MRREEASPDDPAGGLSRGVGSWMAAHAVEVVFAVIIGAVFVWFFRVGAGMYFIGDDWPLLFQGGSFRGMLDPYNDHLSVTILALYRILIEGFGFSYWPFRVVGLVCLLMVPVTYFVTTRRLLSPPVAALAALSLLSYGGLDLSPSWLTNYLVLVGGILCAAALNRGRRADWVLAGALAFSLSAAGGGVAVAAACVVHNLCTRAPLRRWLVVLGPIAMWGVWWFLVGRRQSRSGLSLSESLRYARDIALAPFEHLGLGLPVLTAVVLIAFVGYGLWSLRHGLATAANFLAWGTALAVWAAGLAYSRGPYGFLGPQGGRLEISFRYELLALGFALLAVVPRRPIVWPERFPITTNPRWVTASAVVILMPTLAVAVQTHDTVEARADLIASYTGTTKGYLVTLGLGPDVIPGGAVIRPPFFWLNAGGVRTVLRRHGHPFQSPLASADQRLVDVGGVTALPVDRGDQQCRPLTEPISWLPRPQRPLHLWSDQETWAIYVRRFGTDWIKVAEPEANQVVEVNLPTRAVDQPWEVQADGACRVRAPLPQG